MNFSFKRNLWVTIILVIAILSRIGFEFAIRIFNEEFIVTEFFNVTFRYSTTFLALLIWIRIVIKSEYSISKLPWLILLAVEPFTGLFLFLTFGRDYRESNRYHDHPLAMDGRYLVHEPTTDFELYEYQDIDSEVTDIYKTAFNMTKHHAYLNDSKATVLKNGDRFYPTLIQALQEAESFIFMQFFIIRTDTTGKRILDILAKKANEGVEVKLLYDAVGSVFLHKKYIQSLAASGVTIAKIDPIQFGFFDTRVNYRNHRKITIIDGTKGFIGGMNLADEYWNKSRKYPPFRDTQLLLEGHVLNSLTALFARDWYYATEEFIQDKRYYDAPLIHEGGMIQIIPSGPDFKYPPIRNVYVKMINNAKQSIKIMTPYMALDHELVTSLIIAARGGVEVSIIVPGKPDKKYIYEITRSFFEELLAEGIKIYTYPDTFTHAKVFIIDDNIASCGTYNLDNRSARINFEATALLFKQGVDDLVADYELDRSKANLIDRDKWSKRNIVVRLYEGLISLFAPLV
ncbi:cardiolipin synthase [Candidatus Xianfuyuplasma coldseepsis]|uniref:Cardiolipin synthase n=1 Tax=Candidatus Xianfuyuplasma coldseepsis TaxID=2782163 RepID=A0A7L7KP55_9MOLU|nr:cardiolipin synthase [Xianfuyuplasma coldseepsis]QMS84561.1 cardiolipin synthase [Xianfuyuplasma coldseepsis]